MCPPNHGSCHRRTTRTNTLCCRDAQRSRRFPLVIIANMELRNVRSFVAIAETLSFRVASKHLRISQPALSKQIKQLESEIGVQLFRRQRPHIFLTSAGEIFLERARSLLLESSAAIAEARQVQTGLAGSITIGFVSPAVFAALPRVIKHFRNSRPDGEIRLRELSASAQMSELRQRGIDFALVQTITDPPEFQSIVVTRERLALAHSIHHPLAGSRSAGLNEFLSDVVFLPENEDMAGIRDIILANFAQYGGTPARFQEIRGVQTAISLASTNLGVALVPESAKSMRIPGVQFRTLRKASLPVETRLVWRRGDRSPAVLQLRSALQAIALR